MIKPRIPAGRPSRYFQSIRTRTASAACRSVRSSACYSTVTSASRDGDQPVCPGPERGGERLII
jgi:hypothetical protein